MDFALKISGKMNSTHIAAPRVQQQQCPRKRKSRHQLSAHVKEKVGTSCTLWLTAHVKAQRLHNISSSRR
jgi:hypothetical protein